MRQKIDEYIATSPEVTPFLKLQYDVLRDIVDKGEDGWVELVLVPAGGVLSTPEAGRSYLTAVAIQLVSLISLWNYPMFLLYWTASLWTRLNCEYYSLQNSSKSVRY